MTPADRTEPVKPPTGAGLLLVDRYRLEEPLAAGGMGEVWRATDTLLQRSVAVKLLRASLAEDPIVSERFKREALTAAQLSHPNMAGIYDYVQDNGRRGIVMEYVNGETLGQRLSREGPIEVGEAVRIASGVLSALQAAHDAGIVHRDVKPGNVMLTKSGDVKVTDFGIARAATDTTLTETGMVVGTAHYLSPEQVSGKAATAASDLYSVGAILYEMLSGQKPFQAETPLAVAMRRLTDDPPTLERIRDDVTEPIAQVVARALARDPGDRYASADGMRQALDGALATVQPITEKKRIDPTPTQVLPLDEIAKATADAGTTVSYAKPARPARASDRTGRAPAALVAERRRRDYKRLGLYAILLAVGIGLGVFLFFALAGESGTVTVPTFTNMTRTQAERLAEASGLKLDSRSVQSERRRGQVLDQNPGPGVVIARGGTVVVSVSSGPPPPPATVEIPDVEGRSEESARNELEDRGLVVDDVRRESSSEIDEGDVIRTSPEAGQAVQPGSPVDIVVSSGPPDEGGGRGNKKGGGGGGDG